MDISAGSEINISGQSFQVEERLGSGSQGQVFRGRSPSGEAVALKFVTDFRRRNREIDILEGWSSDHVVGLLGHGAYGQGEVLVMDLVDGVTLQQIQELCARLERGLHPALALELIAHVAQGLDEGYKTLRLKVHRDVKPSNVMLGRDGQAKILDFGIAYGLDLTVTGTPVATPLYMAPEQMEGARPCESLDHRTDQYSLGLLLAELVLGKPLRPMERDALARWLFVPGAELDSATERIGRQAPEILEPLKGMLTWEPEGRFDDMSKVVAALELARERIEGPETLATFAGRLMQVREQGILLHPDDPSLCPLITRIPLPTETILPDMTGRPLPFVAVQASPSLSPIMERRGPVNLAEPFGPSLNALDATGAAVLVRQETLEPKTTPEVADTFEKPIVVNNAPKKVLLLAALLLGVAGTVYWSGQKAPTESNINGDSAAHVRTERVQLASDSAKEVSKSVAEQEAPDTAQSAKQGNLESELRNNQGSSSQKRTAPKVAKSSSKMPLVVPSTGPSEKIRQDWSGSNSRRRIPIDLGSEAVAMPQAVITGSRPGQELDDSAEKKVGAGASTGPDNLSDKSIGLTEGNAPVERTVGPEEFQSEDLVEVAANEQGVLAGPDTDEQEGILTVAAVEAEEADLEVSSSQAIELEVASVPKKPSYLTERQWCRQLLSYGIASRSRGDDELAKNYFDWAAQADPSYTVVEKVASGELNRLPSSEELGASKKELVEGSGQGELDVVPANVDSVELEDGASVKTTPPASDIPVSSASDSAAASESLEAESLATQDTVQEIAGSDPQVAADGLVVPEEVQLFEMMGGEEREPIVP